MYSRTAATMNALAKKGEKYVDAIIELAEEIRNGIGSRTLEKALLQAVNGESAIIEFEKITSLPSGSRQFSWIILRTLWTRGFLKKERFK